MRDFEFGDIRMRKKMSAIIRRSMIVCLALATAGCTLMEDWGHDKPYTLAGRHITDLPPVYQLHFLNGRLIVATGESGNPHGIAIIDTVADTVTKFYALSMGSPTPVSFAPKQDSLLLTYEGWNRRVMVFNALSGTSFQVPTSTPAANPSSPKLIVASGRVFQIEFFYPTGTLTEVLPDLPPFSASIALPHTMTGTTVFGDRILVANRISRHILSYTDGGRRFAPADSFPLFESGEDSVAAFAMVSWEERVFVGVTGIDSSRTVDTAMVLIFNGTTGDLEGRIPLKFRHYSIPSAAPRVVDGVWYLCGTMDEFGSGGGLEAIDLQNPTASKVLVTNQPGNRILDLIPTGTDRGYGLFDTFNSSAPVVKRLTF